MSSNQETLLKKNQVLISLQRAIKQTANLEGKIDEVYDRAESTREIYRQSRANLIEQGIDGKNQEIRDAKIDIQLEQERINCHSAETALAKFEKRVQLQLAKQRGIEKLLDHLKE